MEFIVLNRMKAEAGFDSKLDHIMISMNSPELGPAKIPNNSKLLALLQIECHDVDYNEAGEITAQRGFVEYTEIKKFDKKMALDIIDFVLDHKPQLVVVHCDAGLSRSPAVALALSEIFNKGARTPKMYAQSAVGGFGLYNRHIYRTILSMEKEILKNE